jgi:hypothetical protein
MKLEEIKNPQDILQFMKDNIKYGWLDIYNEEHIGNMENFRRLYRTSTIEETLSHKIGTCIEQVYLMKTILDKLSIPSKMFCTRIYEDDSHTNMEEDEHMHCFVLYYQNDLVYQIEHPNWKRIDIHKFKDEETAISEINKCYLDSVTKKARPVTEFYEVQPNLSFKDFNLYINSLDKVHKK